MPTLSLKRPSSLPAGWTDIELFSYLLHTLATFGRTFNKRSHQIKNIYLENTLYNFLSIFSISFCSWPQELKGGNFSFYCHTLVLQGQFLVSWRKCNFSIYHVYCPSYKFVSSKSTWYVLMWSFILEEVLSQYLHISYFISECSCTLVTWSRRLNPL